MFGWFNSKNGSNNVVENAINDYKSKVSSGEYSGSDKFRINEIRNYGNQLLEKGRTFDADTIDKIYHPNDYGFQGDDRSRYGGRRRKTACRKHRKTKRRRSTRRHHR